MRITNTYLFLILSIHSVRHAVMSHSMSLTLILYSKTMMMASMSSNSRIHQNKPWWRCIPVVKWPEIHHHSETRWISTDQSCQSDQGWMCDTKTWHSSVLSSMLSWICVFRSHTRVTRQPGDKFSASLLNAKCITFPTRVTVSISHFLTVIQTTTVRSCPRLPNIAKRSLGY